MVSMIAFWAYSVLAFFRVRVFSEQNVSGSNPPWQVINTRINFNLLVESEQRLKNRSAVSFRGTINARFMNSYGLGLGLGSEVCFVLGLFAMMYSRSLWASGYSGFFFRN